ncbi:MAG TPA: heme-binding protein [Enteractinococcus helveticum]|uniref:Heme-binding protein n=1 Tax=Enteractinococcus helveticum TaxID=1837282 RepID=A0A921FQQ6_9MICC|nr:heme-binding protein [Enteractinococcus helveticum]HJF15976.1 heme-binding protein [Enteractinococcus helveticum]
MTSNPSTVSLQQAQTVVDACLRRAAELDLKMNVAVVDAGANLKAFGRMDDAWLGSIDISIKKARTARYFDMPTGDLSPMVQPGESLYHLEFSNGGLITFPGGIPLKLDDGTVIGAVGVSGSTVDNDQTIAEAGVAAFEATPK